jgi:hypothetical protein
MADAPQPLGQFEKLLTESRDLVSGQLGAALSGMLNKADQALVALIGDARHREAQKAYQDTRKLLGSEGTKLQTEFQKFYTKEFRARSKVDDGASRSSSETYTSLSLVGDEDLEETLKFRELSTKLRLFCDEELAALDQRIGVLLGDANLRADANPFSPEAICDAYQRACHEVAADPKVRAAMRKLFDDHVIDAVRAIYKAVNALLVNGGILPKIRYKATRAPDSKVAGAKGGKGAAGAKDAGDDHEEQGDPDAAANLFSLLQNLVTANAGAAGFAMGTAPALAPGQRVLQGAELLGSLTRIQRGDVASIRGGLPALVVDGAAPAGAETANVLRELKSSSFGAAMGQMDAMTLDIVAMLFDMLFDDPKIPIALKGLIGRLQIPMLKAAIADKAFFSKKSHPARLMLDAFGEIALRLPPEFAPEHVMFVKLEAIVQYLVGSFQDDVAIFEGVEQQLRAMIAEEDARVAAETREVAEHAEQSENLAVAKSAAEDEVRARVQTHTLPGPVLEFLVQHWLRYLLLLHAKSGADSTEWKGALELMDQMIWSLEAKNTPADRRRLVTLVPGLLKRISAGLQALGADDAVRAALFVELGKVHTGILHPKPKDPAAPEGRKLIPPAPLPDFSAPVTVKNPYGHGEVQVSAPAAIDPPADLEMRDWVEFRPNDGAQKPRAAKLLFHTPKRTRYIFSDRNGKDMLDLTRAEIVRRLRSGEAVRLDKAPEEPLFDRIMNSLLSKLKAPASRAPG